MRCPRCGYTAQPTLRHSWATPLPAPRVHMRHLDKEYPHSVCGMVGVYRQGDIDQAVPFGDVAATTCQRCLIVYEAHTRQETP